MAIQAYISILELEKSGKVTGDCKQKGREGWIFVYAFEHEVVAPRDPHTGQASGKRQHKPLVITKKFDAASPLLYQALCHNEVVKKLELQWFRTAKTGVEEHYFTHKLENAIVTQMRPYMKNTLDPDFTHYEHMEEVAFTYQKISWDAVVDKKAAQDDWLSPAV